MKRWAIIFSLAASLANAPTLAANQPPHIGVLVSGPPPEEHVCVSALRQGLANLGYAEGVSHVLTFRWARGRPEESLPIMAAELVKQGVDLIVSVSSQGLLEAKPAMSSIPVVMAVSSYPVERGLIASLARPGANITGLATWTGDLYKKRLQLLAEALPGVTRVAVLRPSGDMNNLIQRDLEDTAGTLGIKLTVIDVDRKEDLARAFRAATTSGAQAVLTTQSPFFYETRQLLADLALQHKLPSFSGEPLASEAGVLVTHGASVPDSCRRAASYVERILRGKTPAELPVEQPLRYELVINLKTARALNISVPRALLLRAERVIE